MQNQDFDALERETLIDWLPVTDFFVDAYGRHPSEQKLTRMLKAGFHEDKLGVVIGSLRTDGRIATLDGGHRIALLRKLGVRLVLARVFIDKTYEEEAQLFVDLNTVNRTTALDRFRARLESKDPTAHTIKQIVEKHGMTIATRGRGVGTISAIAALDRLFDEQGAAGVYAVVNILHRAWGQQAKAWTSPMIDGLRQLWLRYHSAIDQRRLVERMKAVTPERVGAQAGVFQLKTASVGTLVGKTLHEHYNNGLRTNRLDPWIDRLGTDINGRSRPPKQDATTEGADPPPDP